MFINYLRVAFRTMTRNMRFTVLHLAGLTLGLASVTLIAWYVYDEISFDQLQQADQSFRITTLWGDDPATDIFATTPPPLAWVRPCPASWYSSQKTSYAWLISMVIAIPTSYLVIQNWLNEFTVRIELTFGVFLACSAAALALIWITVSLHSVRIARLNPAVTLKNE